jgi:hypothetical protein
MRSQIFDGVRRARGREQGAGWRLLTRVFEFWGIANARAFDGRRSIKATQRYLGFSTAFCGEAVRRLSYAAPL